MNISVDASKKTVFIAGSYARKVFIDDGSIIFTADLQGSAHYFTINRSTGNMVVQIPSGEWVRGTVCERVKPKF